MDEKKLTVTADDPMLNEDIAEAIEELRSAEYVHKLKKPAIYNGKEYTELHFNFENLTGADSVGVEQEMRALNRGLPYSMPALDSEYLIRIAARAAEEPIGADFMLTLPISDFNAIRNRTQTFLLTSV